MFRDLAVEFVLVQLIHARAERRKALLMSSDLLLALGVAAAHVRIEGIHNRSGNGFRYVDLFQQFAEAVGHVLLAHIRQIAFPATIRASVINIFALLQFGRDRAPIVSAGQQACKSEIVLAVFWFVSSGKRILHALEQFERDQRLMGALVFDPLPKESADVERILQHCFQIRTIDSHAQILHRRFAQRGE